VTGIHGRSGIYIDQLGEHCGVPAVVENRSSAPFSYSLAISPGAMAAARGGTGGSAFDIRCPSGEIVVSLQGRSGSVVDQIAIVCARFDAVGSAPGSGFLIDEVGSRIARPATAGGTGGSPFMLDCPVGYATGRLNGSHGTFVLGMSTFNLVGSVGAWCTRLAAQVR
jgi:hypothetical protein